MRVLITGGTGFLGRPLVRRLIAAGHSARVLSRDAQAAEGLLPKEAEACGWNADGPVPPHALAGIDAVAHCMGENVGQWPWSAERKRRFRASRVEATRHLVESLATLPPRPDGLAEAAGPGGGAPAAAGGTHGTGGNGRERYRPRVLVAASAVGWYGDGGDAWLGESTGSGRGFLAELVRDWEAEIFKAEALGIRTVALRLGVVLGGGGALRKMLPPFRLGLGAVVGNGRQWMSWVHRADAAEAFLFALENDAVRGPVNLCAPEPATNRDFSKALARALKRPLLLRAPAFAVRLALGEMGRETLLASQRVSAEKALALGYPFRYPRLDAALADILAHERRRR